MSRGESLKLRFRGMFGIVVSLGFRYLGSSFFFRFFFSRLFFF